MATGDQAEGSGAAAGAAPTTVGLALSDSKSSAYVLRWALARFATPGDGNPAAFKLVHVLTPVLAVPTPLGGYIPIDKARDEIAEDYIKEVWVKAQKMLSRCKDVCDENKVEAQVLLVTGDDVADAISSLVAEYQIQILVVGNTTRESGGNSTSSRICKSVPSFCAAYVVSEDGSSSVYAPGSDIDAASGSVVPEGNSSSSNTEVFSDDSSQISGLNDNSSGQGLSGFPSLPRSNLSNSSAGRPRFTLYDYLTGTATAYKDKNKRITSCAGAESSISNKPTQDNTLRGLMLSDNKDNVSTVEDDFNKELEKMRVELRQMAYKPGQDGSVDGSHQVVEDVSKGADKKSRLEQLFALEGNSYATFTWEEIDNATSSFSESCKVGTGSNGTVYKGYLNHSDVAIKVLHSINSTSTKHFNQELEVLSRIRHPHLLMLLGACPDRGCLVYEYMENGSLADRLERLKGTPSIPWFHRFRIAWEIVSALAFLHSSKPNPIIHRDLKPENVLLDDNLVSKIGDVGLSTLAPLNESLSSRTMYKKTGLAGTLFYLDPEYQRTGLVSVKSDTYSFGMVILQLLTARSAIGLPELVERAVEDGEIEDVLDESAGNWPLKEAHDLAQLPAHAVGLVTGEGHLANSRAVGLLLAHSFGLVAGEGHLANARVVGLLPAHAVGLVAGEVHLANARTVQAKGLLREGNLAHAFGLVAGAGGCLQGVARPALGRGVQLHTVGLSGFARRLFSSSASGGLDSRVAVLERKEIALNLQISKIQRSLGRIQIAGLTLGTVLVVAPVAGYVWWVGYDGAKTIRGVAADQGVQAASEYALRTLKSSKDYVADTLSMSNLSDILSRCTNGMIGSTRKEQAARKNRLLREKKLQEKRRLNAQASDHERWMAFLMKRPVGESYNKSVALYSLRVMAGSHWLPKEEMAREGLRKNKSNAEEWIALQKMAEEDRKRKYGM